jgi:four helix bundle protein
VSRDHRKLRVFELADGLAKAVYRVTGKFPREEMFGLTSQMRRAAVSVPANIIEGCSRSSEAEYVHFLGIAKASLQELGYYLDLSRHLGFLPESAHGELQDEFGRCIKQLQSLINALRKQRGSGLKARPGDVP